MKINTFKESLSLFKNTNQLTPQIEKVCDVLKTVQPTSVNSERVHSHGKSVTKKSDVIIKIKIVTKNTAVANLIKNRDEKYGRFQINKNLELEVLCFWFF